MSKNAERFPSDGEVWAVPCQFVWRTFNTKFAKGAKVLRPGPRRDETGTHCEVTGHEMRHVVAVVTVPGYQRQVIFAKQYAPDGHKPFGNTDLHIMSLYAFNRWKKGTLRGSKSPAALIEPSTVEKAIKILEAAA